MSNLERRSSRSQRVDKAYRLTLATGGFGVAAAVALVLSIAGVVGFGLVVLLAAVAAVCGIMLRSSLR